MQSEVDSGHITAPTGPWIGVATNGFDPSRLNHGALKKADNLIFADYIQGKGTETEARIRPGRHDWNTDDLKQRYYLAEMETGEATWTAGAQDLTRSKTGYASRRITHGGAATTDMYRTFTGKDASQGAVLTAARANLTLVIWMRASTAAAIIPATSSIKLTSDVAPGAPAGWTDKLTIPFTALSSSPAAMPNNTWTKFTCPLASATLGGTFLYTSITGVDIELSGGGAVDANFDEVYLENGLGAQTVGLGEFIKSTTGERFLLAKAGDTLYIDKNESLVFTKVVSGLQRNKACRFVKVFNQIFCSDGDQMFAIDGTLNTNSAYNYRLMGFPVPSAAGVGAAPVAGGTVSDAGVHHVWFNYVYGQGTVRYGQSSLTYLGTITIGAGQQYRFTSLPVPAESEGVVAKRLWIGLAEDQKDAQVYFADEITAADTSEDVDIADVTLAAATNPAGPRDNGVPTAAEYIYGYEGSMIFMNLVGNPIAVSWSRKGNDLNSGPEIVPLGNVVISQRGEAWSGGFVRGSIAHMFTRRSIHEGRFDQFGNLNIREIDQAVSGASQSVGAIDQNAIWGDDQANVWFWSEQGGCVIEPSGRIRLVFKDRLLDEYKDINDKVSANSFSFRSVNSQAEWQENDVTGGNLIADTFGALTYQYPNLESGLDVGGLSYQHPFTASGEMRGNGFLWPPPNYIDFSADGVNGASVNRNYIPAGKTMYVLAKANIDLLISGLSITGRLGNGAAQQVVFGIYKYKYEFGRKATFGESETAMVSTAVATVNGETHTGATDDMKQWNGNFASAVYVPKGEWVWLSFTNASQTRLKFKLVGHLDATPAGLSVETNPGQYVSDTNIEFGGNALSPGSWSPDIGITSYKAQLVHTVTAGDTASTGIQRFGHVTDSDPDLNSTQQREVTFETSIDGITYDTSQVVVRKNFVAIGTPPAETGTPFWQVPDYRPLSTIPGYPHLTQRRYTRWTQTTTLGSTRGSLVTKASDSLVSTSYDTAFTGDGQFDISQSNESAFTEPYASDLYTKDPYLLDVTPAAWGRFNVDFTQLQQKITMQARTGTDVTDVLARTWNTITMNTIPTTTELPIYGPALQVRFLFTDDETQLDGLMSFIQSYTLTWRTSAENLLAPIVPPTACFFDRYSLVAYAPAGSRTNSLAWCVSPGVKLSNWQNQGINCFCIYDGQLLAGRANYSKVSKLWDNDYLDDARGNIRGYLLTMPTDLGTDKVKTIMGGYVHTGVREFKGIPTTAADITPVPPFPPAYDFFQAGVTSGSQDNYVPAFSSGAAVMTPALTLTALNTFGADRYSRESHSTPLPIGVVGGDAFYQSYGRQDALVQVFWQAFTHAIKNRNLAATPYVRRFPYITDLKLECFVENYYGVQQ